MVGLKKGRDVVISLHLAENLGTTFHENTHEARVLARGLARGSTDDADLPPRFVLHLGVSLQSSSGHSSLLPKHGMLNFALVSLWLCVNSALHLLSHKRSSLTALVEIPRA